MDLISDDELVNTIHNLADGKAAGPSKISNEMLKHLSSQMLKHIKSLMNSCLEINDIPEFWKQANLYLIPKLKAWNYNLNNT